LTCGDFCCRWKDNHHAKSFSREFRDDVVAIARPRKASKYCYDRADRLLVSYVTGAIPAANPVADGLGPAELAHDFHGNTISLANQTLVFDMANRHLATTVTDTNASTTTDDTRDANDRTVAGGCGFVTAGHSL